MQITHSEYKVSESKLPRRRPEAIALLMMSMTISATTNANISSELVRSNSQMSGLFDASRLSYEADAVSIFMCEQRKRHLKQRIYNVADVNLPDDIFLLPYETADLLESLGVEPDYILATEDNGLSIEFRHNDIYHLIEFLSTGEIVLLRKQGKKIDTWDLTSDNYLDTLQAQIA